MDQATLVEPPLRAGERFLEQFDQYMPVVVAFWLRDSENGRWTLFIASDAIRDENRDIAFGEVIRIASQINDSDFDPFQVRLLRMSDQMVKEALRIYSRHPPRVPLHIRGANFGADFDEAYMVRGPTRSYKMATGRETLNQIIDAEADFFQRNGVPPRKMKLPVLMAYDLAKCGRDELGDISGRIFKDGISVLEKDGFHGMNVEIIRTRDASLEFE